MNGHIFDQTSSNFKRTFSKLQLQHYKKTDFSRFQMKAIIEWHNYKIRAFFTTRKNVSSLNALLTQFMGYLFSFDMYKN